MNKVMKLNSLAEEMGLSIAQLALNWVKSHSFVTSVLVGVSSLEQLEYNLKLIELEPFSQSQMEEINALMI